METLVDHLIATIRALFLVGVLYLFAQGLVTAAIISNYWVATHKLSEERRAWYSQCVALTNNASTCGQAVLPPIPAE